VICACLLGTAACLWLFQADLNRSLNRIDEEPAGFVVSSSRAALRRFQDRSIWDRLRKDSAVYNGDFIRTSELSQASVSLSGGGLIGISENSLVRIFVEAGVSRIDFSRGSVSVHAGETEGLTLSFGGNQIKTAAGTVVTLDAGTGEEEVFNIQVIEGNASLVSPAEERELVAGTTVSLNAEGTEHEEAAVRLSVIEPPPESRFITLVDDTTPVEFVWNSSAASPEAPVRIEISRNRDFHSLLTLWEGPAAGSGSLSSHSVEIPPGIWWWRLSSPEEEGEEVIRQLIVVHTPPPKPVSPAPEAVYYYLTEPPELRFQWETPEEALYYVLEAADNPDIKDPVLLTEVRHNSLIYSGLVGGRWYWRVTPVFSAAYRGTAPASPVVPFTIVRGDPPVQPVEAVPPETAAAVDPPPAQSAEVPSETAAAAVVEPPPPQPPAPAATTVVEPPQPLSPPQSPPPPPVAAIEKPSPPPPLPPVSGRKPENGYVIDSEPLLESRTLVFNWDPVAEADIYVFTLFRETDSGLRQSIISSSGPKTSYTLENLSLLDLGHFVWQVEALSLRDDGTVLRNGIPSENRFVVNIPIPDIPRGRDPEVFYGR
jgi:hypothetical protein